MQFNVATQLREPIGAVRRHALEGQVEHAPVTGQAIFTRTDAGILVQAACETQATWTCARCLTDYTTRLDLEIEEEFFPHRDVFTGETIKVEDESFRIDDLHTLDLGAAIAEYAALAMPIKPLCRPDCAGLCQDCGANLNQAPCSCNTGKAHPAFAELGKRWARLHAS
jgi:uncharacterized protein